MLYNENLQFFLKLGLKLKKKKNQVLEFNQSQQLKPDVKFNIQKQIEPGKNGDKNGKALYKLMDVKLM